MRGRWGSRKRRMALTAVGALAVGIAAPLVAPSAGAVISNPGNLRVSIHLAMYTPSFTIVGMTTRGSGDATIQPNGFVVIPQESLSFAPVKVQVDLPDGNGQPAPSAVTVQAVATSDFTGALDPATGSSFIIGNIQELWSQGSALPSCSVGPFRFIVRTNTQGGIAYSAQSGAVTMVDPNYTIDAIPNAANGCGGLEGAINGALSLPVTTTTTTTADPRAATTTTTTNPYSTDPPVPSLVAALTFSPAPRAAVIREQQPPPHAPGTTTHTTTPHTQPSIPDFGTPPPDNPDQLSGFGTNNGGSNNNNNSGGGGGQTTRRKSVSKKVRHPERHQKKNTTTTVKKTGPGIIKVVPKSGSKSSALGSGTKPKAKTSTAKKSSAKKLTFVAAAFTKHSASALSTFLNLLGIIGLLVFTSLALWLVSSEVSTFSAGQRRRRMHRIAGITK